MPAGDVDDALKLLNQAEARMIAGSTDTNASGPFRDHNSYTILMQAWASRDATTPERLEPFLERMKESATQPARQPALTYNAVSDLGYEYWVKRRTKTHTKTPTTFLSRICPAKHL
jgi:hypothetical protein